MISIHHLVLQASCTSWGYRVTTHMADCTRRDLDRHTLPCTRNVPGDVPAMYTHYAQLPSMSIEYAAVLMVKEEWVSIPVCRQNARSSVDGRLSGAAQSWVTYSLGTALYVNFLLLVQRNEAVSKGEAHAAE